MNNLLDNKMFNKGIVFLNFFYFSEYPNGFLIVVVATALDDLCHIQLEENK